MHNEELPHLSQEPGDPTGASAELPSPEVAGDPHRSTLLNSVVETPAAAVEYGQEQDGETRDLQAILGEYREVIGDDVEVVRIGESGYVVRLGMRPPNRNGDWILYDVDDTAISYTQAKPVRLAHYTDHLKNVDISLSNDSANDILDTTDALSRWQVHGRKMYHVDAHLKLVAWATERVSQLDDSERDQWVRDFKAQAAQLAEEQPERTSDDVPFYFSNGELVFKADMPGADRSREIYKTVFDAMIRPNRNQDLLDTMVQLDEDTKDESFRLNQGILTYGSPDFQLRKTLEVLKDMHEAGTELPISSILLSKVKKGAFLKELVTFDPRTNVSAPPSNVAEDFFDDVPHAIMLVDDDPKEIESFVSFNGNYEDFRYDLDLMGVRYRREGTKNYIAAGAYGGYDGRVGYHHVEGRWPNLRRGIYEVLNTQVTPPRDSAPGRELRWGNSLSKGSLYRQMLKVLHPNYDPEYPHLHDGVPSYVSMETYRKMDLERARIEHREAEYAAGRRLPFDTKAINEKYYAAA